MPSPADKLSPTHLADLRASGLSGETILKSGVFSALPRDFNKILGPGFPKSERINSLLTYPYPGSDGFARYRLFPPTGNRKYHQKGGTGNRLYFPPGVEKVLPDTSIPLYITEGEKKSLKATQEGIPCVGLPGLWGWSDGGEEKRLIPDFNKINFQGRTVCIVPDNDWLNPDRHGERKNLRQAVYELAYRLIDLGARVSVLELPQGTEKGIDDYLCRFSVEQFNALPRKEIRKQTIDEMIESLTPQSYENNRKELLTKIHQLPPTLQDIEIRKMSEKLKMGTRPLKQELKALDSKQGDGVKLVPTAYFPGIVDLCLDPEGNVAFLVKKDNEIFVSKTHEIDGVIYKPPKKDNIPYRISSYEDILKYVKTDNDRELFDDLCCTLKKYSYLPDHYFLIIALSIFLTYIHDHKDIAFLPMILFWAVQERGKSQTGKAASYCSYRGINVSGIKESNLFRYSQDHHATIFFDMMDLWKAVEKTGTEDIFLQRFERGRKVSRVLYPDKGAFEDMRWFDIYGPTIIATNEPVHRILDSRCLAITMPNKPNEYEDPKEEKFLEMKHRLTAWKVRVMDQPLPQAQGIISTKLGRFWNISKPLIQLCQMICPNQLGALREALVEMSSQRIEDKADSPEGDIIKALKELPHDEVWEWRIRIQDIADRVNEDRPDKYKITARGIGQKIKALGIRKKSIRGAYYALLTQSILDDLVTQFGLNNIPYVPPVQCLQRLQRLQPNEIINENRGDIGEDIEDVPLQCPPSQGQLFQGVEDIEDIEDVCRRGIDNILNLRNGEI